MRGAEWRDWAGRSLLVPCQRGDRLPAASVSRAMCNGVLSQLREPKEVVRYSWTPEVQPHCREKRRHNDLAAMRLLSSVRRRTKRSRSDHAVRPRIYHRDRRRLRSISRTARSERFARGETHVSWPLQRRGMDGGAAYYVWS